MAFSPLLSRSCYWEILNLAIRGPQGILRLLILNNYTSHMKIRQRLIAYFHGRASKNS